MNYISNVDLARLQKGRPKSYNQYYVRLIDKDGLFIEDGFVDDLTNFTIETPCPSGFYLPKWTGEKWVEGGVKPEPTPQEPPTEERLEALELMELERLMSDD